MKNKAIKKICILILVILMAFIPIYSYASGTLSTTLDPGDWKPSDLSSNDVDDVMDKASVIVTIIRAIGIVVTVIALMIMGIKYMTGSIEEKAEYKKSMIPFLIGTLFVFTLSQILAVVIEVVSNFD